MNRSFNPTSRWHRSLFGVAGVLVSLTILSSLHALAGHYQASSPVVASVQAVKTAQR
jgi:hypothetical protein